MRIGEVANQTGFTVDTIRYYERRGLIDPPQRTPSGYRTYDPAVIERLEAIRRTQHLGLTLDEIADTLRAHDNGTATCHNQRWRLDNVVERIDAKISELAELRATVNAMQASCDDGACQLLDTTR